MFCVGSPLAVFIIMRGGRCGVIPEKNKVERVYNIFHPYDPVAYRLEPLFHENYRYIRPLKLFAYNDSKHLYSNVPFECHKSYLKRKKKERANVCFFIKEKKLLKFIFRARMKWKSRL